MNSIRSTNLLLLVIAICLIAIAVKQIPGLILREAIAQTQPTSVRLMGCFRIHTGAACQDVQVSFDNRGYLNVVVAR